MLQKNPALYEIVLLTDEYHNMLKVAPEMRQVLINKLIKKLKAVGINADNDYIKIRINTMHKYYQLHKQGIVNGEYLKKIGMPENVAAICKARVDNRENFNNFKEKVFAAFAPKPELENLFDVNTQAALPSPQQEYTYAEPPPQQSHIQEPIKQMEATPQEVIINQRGGATNVVNRLRCQSCGGTNLHPITKTETKVSGGGYGFLDGCCGYILLGPVGLLCGLCGKEAEAKSKNETYWACGDCGYQFRDENELQKEQEDLEYWKRKKRNIYLIIFAVFFIVMVIVKNYNNCYG